MIVSSEGDCGDIVFLLAILKELEGAPHTLLLESSYATKANGAAGVQLLHDLVAPLAACQPYIKDCRIINGRDRVDWRSGGFRMKFYTVGQTLMLAHLSHLITTQGIGSHLKNIVGNRPWLDGIEPSMVTRDRVVINRTSRYRNSSFNWEKVVNHYRHRLMFVGLEHEWKDFVGEHGYVDFYPTSNLLEVARLIAGCELFIGNQSVANAIAEGLKKRSIQETSLRVPDCIYHRSNAQYVTTGDFHLPNVYMSGELNVQAPPPPPLSFNTQAAPPEGWCFRGRRMGMGFSGAVNRMMLLDEFKSRPRSIVESVLIEENVERCKEFFMRQQPDLSFAARVAVAEAEKRAKS